MSDLATEPESDLSELERVAEEFFKTDEPESVEAADDDAEEEEAPEPEVVGEEAPEPPAGDDTFEYEEGHSLTKAEIKERDEFYQFFETNPAFAAHVLTFFQAPGGAEESAPASSALPAPPQFELPEGFDPDDPVVKAFTPILEYQYQQLQGQQAQLAQVQQQLATRTNADNEAIVNRVAADFAVRHDLNETQLTQVRDAAGRLGVLPSLLSGVDPITGKPSKPDTMTAVDRAMEIAYLQFPEYKAKELEQVAKRQSEDKKRKAKLGAISGSSGGGPKTPPPTEDSREARIAFMADKMKGEG